MARCEWDEKNPKKVADDWKYHCIAAARYGSLIPVELPTFDPEEVDTEAKRFWKPFMDKMAKAEEEHEFEELDDDVVEDPFEEEGLVAAEFEADVDG